MAKQGARDRAKELKKKAELRKISEMRANLAKEAGERHVIKRKLDEARKGLAAAKDKRKRAGKKLMLETQMKGLREEAKHWDKYLGRLDKKQKATKAIKTGAEVAALATGVGGVAKAAGKKVVKEVLKRAAKRTPKKPVKVTPTSKFAGRTIKAKSKEAVKGAGKGRPVHLEQTIVKGKKATTVRPAPNKPTISNRKRVGTKTAAPKKPATKGKADILKNLGRASESLKKMSKQYKLAKKGKAVRRLTPKQKQVQKAVQKAAAESNKGFSEKAKAALRKGVKKKKKSLPRKN